MPKGVACPNGTLGPGVNVAPLVFTAASDTPPGEAEIRVHTWTTIDGRRVERDARGVTQTVANQQGSRMARDIVLAVRPSAPYAATASPATLTIPQGGAFDLKVAGSRRWPEFKNGVQLSGLDIPSGFTVAALTATPGQTEGSVHVTISGNVHPGVYTLLLQAEAQAPFTKDPSGKDRNDIRVVDRDTPISVVVTPKQPAFDRLRKRPLVPGHGCWSGRPSVDPCPGSSNNSGGCGSLNPGEHAGARPTAPAA